jgi:hypothetical protein
MTHPCLHRRILVGFESNQEIPSHLFVNAKCISGAIGISHQVSFQKICCFTMQAVTARAGQHLFQGYAISKQNIGWQ